MLRYVPQADASQTYHLTIHAQMREPETRNGPVQHVSVTNTAAAGVCMHGRCVVVVRELVGPMRDRKFCNQISKYLLVRAVGEVVFNVFITRSLALHVSFTCIGNVVITAAIQFQLAI